MSKLHAKRMPSPRMIQTWAHMIEREKNDARSFRDCGVRIGLHVAPLPRELDRLMDRWRNAASRMTPDEAYVEFESDPPVDGNGCTGKNVFNWLNGRLEHPVLPTVPATWVIP